MNAFHFTDARRWFVGAAGAVAFTLTLTVPAYGGVTTDGSLGRAGALSGPTYQITSDLGRQVGGNLFHSFGQFSVNTGESATFSGPNSVSNIIGRVTGGQASLIDGTLRSTIPGANLYLLNPAGMLFGENARLDVNGSVHISTADALRLSDGGRFDARNPAHSVLTVAPVAAFGFLSASPAPIAVNGGFLRVPEGQTLSLIGGDISLHNATLYASAGRINLASVGSAGEVAPTDSDLAMVGFGRLGTLTLERGAADQVVVNRGDPFGDVPLADIDTSGAGGGAIFIRGGKWYSQSGVVISDSFGDRDGYDINVALQDEMQFENNASLITESYGSGHAGSVVVDVGRLDLSGGSFIYSSAYDAGDAGAIRVRTRNLFIDGQGSTIPTGISSIASPGSTGASGDITISVIDTLSLVSSGNITAGTFADGNAGTITVNAGNLLVDGQGSTDLTGITSGAYPGSTGAGGAVNIMVNTLSLVNGGSISAGTFADGNAGTITVNAGNLLVDGQGSAALTGITSGVYSGSTGAGGAVNIGVANTLSLANGGSISAGTFADGDAGTITVNAGNLLVDGQGSTALTGITSGAYPGSTGAGGEIRLTVADTLSLANGGGIVAGAFSSGAGGRINISVGGAATIAGADATGRPSRLLSSAEGTGQAGDISLTTSQLSISNGGGIFATSKRTAGGNLLINADRLLLDGGQISASVFGDQKTQGGNVEINGAQLIALNGGKVTATATQGLGGRITVNTDIFLFNAATAQDVLDASSGTAGNDGAVQNNAPVTDISANFTALPVAYLDAAGQLSRRCGGNSADERSRFTVQSREGLPPAPDEMLSAPVRRCSLPPDPRLITGSSDNTP